jgi:rhodanese-related sulfurtransferase
MNIKKQFLIIGLIVIPIAAGVIIRETKTYRFGHDARALAGHSFDSSRVIGWEQLAAMKNSTLLIDLSTNGVLKESRISGTVHIPAARLLEKASLDTLREHADDIRILYSTNQGESARAWMVLSQMGYRDLYILADDRGEEMKYPFRPEPALTETDQ